MVTYKSFVYILSHGEVAKNGILPAEGLKQANFKGKLFKVCLPRNHRKEACPLEERK